MNKTEQNIDRLLQSLERLGIKEDIAIAHGDGSLLLELQTRSEPLVARLLTHSEANGHRLSPSLKQRIRAWSDQHHERLQRLRVQLDCLKEQLFQVTTARRQIARFKPAYLGGKSSSSPSKLAFQG